MRSPLSSLSLLRPRTEREALAAMTASEAPRPIAGGTDLYVTLHAGASHGSAYLDLSRIKPWQRIEHDARGVTLGATVTFLRIQEDAAIRRRLPALAAAAAEVGAWPIQARATIGGNIANASPAGDSLPVLLAYDAIVHLRSVRGTREVPFAELLTGYRTLAMERDELIAAVRIPDPARGVTTFFRKVGTRRAQSISKVVFCAAFGFDAKGRTSHVRLAYGSMAATTRRAALAEAAFMGQKPAAALEAAVAALAQDLTPIDDVRSDAAYRADIAARLLEQCVRVVAGKR
jgi:CO/xanthine dehydrogenase FAD-binding subunit